jgi:branched-chain amino acid transport system substrate-binding protein
MFFAAFLQPWRAKFQDRDPNWGGRGWDAVMLTVKAVEQAGSTEGPKVRDALESIKGWQGTTGVYNFSPDNHQGITENPLYLAQIKDGKVIIVQEPNTTKG